MVNTIGNKIKQIYKKTILRRLVANYLIYKVLT